MKIILSKILNEDETLYTAGMCKKISFGPVTPSVAELLANRS